MPKSFSAQTAKWLLLSLLVVVTASCASMAPQRTLYEQLGGGEKITAFTARLVEFMQTDQRLAPAFELTDMPRLEKLLVEQFCELSDGPCRYSGVSMQESHRGLAITEAEFNALVEMLQVAMSEHQVPLSAQNQLLAKLAPMHKDIVGK